MSINWNVGNIIRKRAGITPEKVAIVFEDEDVSYLELHKNSNKVARMLQKMGIRKGDRVGVLLNNCVEYMEIYFAVATIGAIFVPLNWRLVGRELEFQLNDCEAKTLFFHDSFSKTVDEIKNRIKVDDNKFVFVKMKSSKAECPAFSCEYNILREQNSVDDPLVDEPTEIDDPLAIVYTSGTTGDPKGAVVSHQQTFYKIFQVGTYTEARPDDVIIAQMPLFHSGGLFIVATPSIAAGMKMVLRAGFNPIEFARDIEKYRGTVVFALTTMWKMILATKMLDKVDTSCVRCVFGGGERTPASLLEELAKRGLYMQQGFGQTENSAMMLMPKDDVLRKMGSVGKPGFYTDVWIVGKNGERLSHGEVGRIVASGPTVMSGYWNLPKETEDVLVDGVLYTGDLGYMDEEGFLYIVDREKDMYRSGGENVYPAEVEKILMEHPSINNVAVVGVADEKWGQTGKAYILPEMNKTITLEEVREFLSGKVSRYKLPSNIQLVKDLPMTPTMKVKKSELKKLEAQ